MIEGSRERKSLSGAIKVAKLNTPGNNKFWNAIADHVKKNDVDPKFVINHATEKEKFLLNKDREFKKNDKNERIEREKWSAWMIQKIIRRYVLEKSEK